MGKFQHQKNFEKIDRPNIKVLMIDGGEASLNIIALSSKAKLIINLLVDN